MNNKNKTTIAGILSISIMAAPLTSCSLDDTGMTQIQGSTLGALGGAVVGGAIGLAVGGDTKSVVAGAIAGGLLGGAAGLQWANSIVKEKASYASMEEYINDNQKQLDNRITDVKKANSDLSNQIAQLKKDKTAVSKANIAKQNAKLTENLALIDTDITTAKDAAKEASGAELTELNQKIDTLSKEKASLQANISELDSLSSI